MNILLLLGTTKIQVIKKSYNKIVQNTIVLKKISKKEKYKK